MTIIICSVIQADQPTIVAMIRQARINPRNLHWEGFLIAEKDGKIVWSVRSRFTSKAREKWHLDLSYRNMNTKESAYNL